MKTSRDLRKVSRSIFVPVAIFLIAMISPPASAATQGNLLLNPDLTEGTGNSPANWQAQSFRAEKDGNYTAPLEWSPNRTPAELVVQNPSSDDARWAQVLDLQQGWYHFTAEVQTQSVDENYIGANLSLLEGWINSHDVRGTKAWQPVGFYLQVGPDGARVTLACRLGMYSNPNTGTAVFRNVTATKVAGPTDSSDPVYQM